MAFSESTAYVLVYNGALTPIEATSDVEARAVAEKVISDPETTDLRAYFFPVKMIKETA